MAQTILLAAWVGLSFILYKIVHSIITSRQHAAAARKLGCGPASSFVGFDILGIRNLRNIIKADQSGLVTPYFLHRVKEACEAEGRNVTTFTSNILGNEAVFTVEPRNVQALLATQFKDFGLGETRRKNFNPLLGDGIFSTDGKLWEHARALLRPQFARDQVSDLDLEETHVTHLMRAIPAGQNGWTGIVDIKPLFFRLTLDSATEFLFGESVDSQLANIPGHVSSKPPMSVNEQQFATSFDQAQQAMAAAGRLGDKYWLAHTKEFKWHSKQCHDFIDHYVQIALTKKKTGPQTTSHGKEKYVFLDALAESTRDPIELRTQMISILLAGRDTTASLLSYLFVLFTQHPRVYTKLRGIILEEFGTYDNPKNITFASLKSCNYLQWVLNETLRVYPVVPIDGRRALKNTTIPTGGGPDGTSPVYIKEGTEVSYSVFIMHRRKDLWGPDAEEFRPERWDGRKSGWEYLPFNGGPRICIGQQFALTEAGYVVTRLLQRFEQIEGVGNHWEDPSKGGVGHIKHALSLTSVPAEQVNVRFKEAAL